MKYNKYQRILCFFTAFIFTFCVVLSPLSTSASVGWYDLYQTFWDDFSTALELVNSQVAEDVNNSNLDSETKKRISAILAVQQTYLHDLPDPTILPSLPGYPDIDNSESFTINMSGFSGLYTSRLDGKIHSATSQFITNDGVFVSSDEFQVAVSHVSHGYGGRFNVSESSTSGGYSFTTLPDQYNRTVSWSISGTGNYFTSSGSYEQSQNSTHGRYVDFNSSPSLVLPASLLYSFNSSNSVSFGGWGSSFEMPSDNVYYTHPWDYYNDSILPYLRENFNFPEINNFLVFPNGYDPGLPFEQNFPNGTLIFNNNNININIEINYPTDESGENITDESGETVTETVIITDTTPTDAVYNFNIPTLPNLNLQNYSPPYDTNVTSFITPVSGFFSLIESIFDWSGVLDVLPVLMTFGVITFVIYKCS